jgi:hypothetical protein
MLFGLFTTAGEINRQYKNLSEAPVQDPDFKGGKK